MDAGLGYLLKACSGCLEFTWRCDMHIEIDARVLLMMVIIILL